MNEKDGKPIIRVMKPEEDRDPHLIGMTEAEKMREKINVTISIIIAFTFGMGISMGFRYGLSFFNMFKPFTTYTCYTDTEKPKNLSPEQKALMKKYGLE